MNFSLSLLSLLACSALLKATPIPASPFQDGMVLQWGKPIPVWGTAPVGEEVSVTINGQSASASAGEDGRWKAMLPALESGGPHVLSISGGGSTVTLDDVLIGDVWVVCGQSNMKRPPLSIVLNSAPYIDDIQNNDLPVRCLEVAEMVATSPQDQGEMAWLDESSVGNWSAVGTIFAAQLHEATGRPVGILWTAWGSTEVEAWMPRELTAEFPHFADQIADFEANDEATVNGMLDGEIPYDANFVRARPSIIYNQMIHPLLPFGISGFLWYQGESNSDDIEETAQYGFTLPSFVRKYQDLFEQGELPFLVVQLPSFDVDTWPWLRESQTRATQAPNTHLAITINYGLATNIHPLDKEPIGQALALLARRYAYDEDILADSPTFEAVTISGSQATIDFTNNTGLQTTDGQPATQFELAGADQVFHPATNVAILRGGRVLVESSEVPAPVAVRYAWQPFLAYQLNLVNSAGLLTAPFRTDSWPLPGLGSQAPLSVADSYLAQPGQPFTSPTAGVLLNDIDLNRDPLSATLVDDVQNGQLSLLEDGTFTYTPSPGFTGVDSFTYTSSDGNPGSVSPIATVTITVNPTESGFDAWQASIDWNGADNTPEGDPDADGNSNFIEYALGLDPLSPSTTGLPILTKDGTNFLFDFNNLRPGVSYEVQVSSDLEVWTDPAFAELTNESTTPVLIPGVAESGAKLFIRLRVSE